MILSGLERYRDFGLLLLRVGLGVMFVYHGAPKLAGGPEAWTGLGGAMANFGVTSMPALWGFMAAVSELGGGICLILGLAVRPACLLMLATMVVAARYHLAAGDGLDGAAHAIESGIVFLALVIVGPGRFSIDRK
jgi:putative oxidoreductase